MRDDKDQRKWPALRQTIVKPFWVPNPLAWKTGGIVGLSHFASAGMVGRFNLCWLMLQCKEPPTDAAAYREADLGWVIMLANSVTIKGMTLEHHAAVRTLYEFHMLVKPCAKGKDVPYGVPWTKLATYSERTLA